MRRRVTVAGALLLAWTALADSAWAQKPIPETVRMMPPYRLRIGDYVRAWPSTESRTVQGPIVAFSPTTLTLAGREEAALIDLASASKLEVRRRHAHYTRNALIGAGLGLLAGAFLITDDVVDHHIDGWERVGWMAGLSAGGAVLGLGVARVARHDTWEPVDLITMKPRAADAGPAVRLSWTLRF
jgi:hypothetical protein